MTLLYWVAQRWWSKLSLKDQTYSTYVKAVGQEVLHPKVILLQTGGNPLIISKRKRHFLLINIMLFNSDSENL